MSSHPRYYATLYESHDDAIRKRRTDEARIQEREAKRRMLETLYDDLTELPALRSFLTIQGAAAEEGLERHTPSDCEESANGIAKAKVRDGFERMQRCRMALEALDQGGWKRRWVKKEVPQHYYSKLTCCLKQNTATTSACSTRHTSQRAPDHSGSWTLLAPSPGRTRRYSRSTTGTAWHRRS